MDDSGDIDYGALFGTDPAAAGNQAAALAQAIRQRRAAGTLGMITGDPAMSGVGQQFEGQANAMQQTLGGSGEKRAEHALQERHLGVQEQQMENMLRHQQTMEDVAANRLGQGDQRLAIERQALANRLAIAEQNLGQRGIRYNQNTGQYENVSPGKVPVSAAAPPTPSSLLPASTAAAGGGGPPTTTTPSGQPQAPPASPAGPPMAGKMLDKALKELGEDFDPNRGRSGELGKNMARVNAASRIVALGADENGNPRNLTPQQMPEMAQSLASLISGGGGGAQAQIEHLLPKSYTRDAAGILQYFTDEPQGAGQQAFVQQMLDTAKRERDVAAKAMQTAVTQRLGKHQMVLSRNPAEAAQTLSGYGFDYDPKTKSITPHGAAPPTGVAAGVKAVASKAERDALAPGTQYTRPGDSTVYVR